MRTECHTRRERRGGATSTLCNACGLEDSVVVIALNTMLTRMQLMLVSAAALQGIW